MIGTSSYVTSMKKGRAIGGCLCSGSGSGGVTSLNGETGAITIIGTGDTTVTNVGPVFTINSTGGSGGLFLPLAGGNMDASPAGVIGAHTISGLTTLESDNAGNDLSILTQAGGSDINIDATASSGFVNVDAYATTITTGTGAGAEVDIRGKVVIQPPAGYSYPDVPQLGGLCIKNWNNTNAAPGNSMFACEIDTIDSIGNAVAIGGGIITSSTASAAGINFSNISAPNGDTIGVEISTMTSGIVGTGFKVSNVNAELQAEGFNCKNIVSDTGDAVGLATRDIISTAAGGYAINCINITGAVSGVGASFNSISGPAATGVIVSSVNSSSTTAMGVSINSVDGPMDAYGVSLNNINSTGASFGIDIQNITGDGQVIGIQTQNVTTTSGNAFGMIVGNTVGPAGAVGIQMNGVDAAQIPGSGANATGIESAGVYGDGETVGIDTFKVIGNNTSGVWGIRVRDIKGEDIVGAVGGNDVVGMEINTVRDEVGNGPSTGIRIGKIYNNNANSQSYGISMSDVINGDARGMFIQNVAGGDIGRGVDVDNVTAKQEAIGYKIENITSDFQDCHGFKAFRMISDAGNCYGAKIDRVVANTEVAYGINVNDVNGTARTYGIYLGPNMTVGSGGTILGFFQEGSAGNKVRNNFDNEISCGSQEDPNTGLSLTIKGNAFYSAQFLNGPGAIVENGGNLIILNNVSSSYAVSLPSSYVREGHQYTICMKNTGSVTLNAGGGILVNGGVSYTINGITLPDYKMYQAFYTIASGVGEWYIG